MKAAQHLVDAILEAVCRFKPECPDFIEIDTIIASVAVFNMLDGCLGQDAPDLLCHVAQSVVEAGITDVEDLPADLRQRRIKHGENTLSNITYMDERTPLLAIEDSNNSLFIGLCGQQ